MLDLVKLFNSLSTPDNFGNAEYMHFVAQLLPGYERYHLGKDLNSKPVLLIRITSDSVLPPSPPVELENLRVMHNMHCRTRRPDGQTEDGQFTIIACMSNNRDLQSYFLRIMSTLVVSLGAAPSRLEVSRVIDNLIELFRALSEPPRKSIQGLWAELILIARAREADVMIKAWHTTPEDHYDFSAGNLRIEVKSTAGRTRRHHFSLEQLAPPENTKLLIASVFVEKSGAGTSVMDLVDEVSSRVKDNSSLLLKLNKTIALTLGNSWRYAIQDRFDRELAEESLAFFEVSEVPCVNRELPSGVTGVHFQSDLSSSATADLQACSAIGGLFQSAIASKAIGKRGE